MITKFYKRIVNHQKLIIAIFLVLFAVCAVCKQFVAVNYYICSKYRQLGKDACTRHTVGEDMLSKYILKELYNDAKLYRDGLNTLKQREEEYKKRISENDLSLEISNYRKSADKLQEQKRVWIRNAVNGVITEEEADAEVRRLSEEQERINKAISALEKKNGKPDGLKISENSLI